MLPYQFLKDFSLHIAATYIQLLQLHSVNHGILFTRTLRKWESINYILIWNPFLLCHAMSICSGILVTAPVSLSFAVA